METSISTAEPFAAPLAQGHTRNDPQLDGWIFAAIEEYKSVRTESLDSMKVQNTILSYGVTAIVLILTAAISIIDKESLLIVDEAIFLILMPSIIFFIVMIWAGEVARMYRAGSFLVQQELIISQYVNKVTLHNSWNKPALSWENWLLRGTTHNSETPHQKLYMQHYSVLAMFVFFAILSITIGNYKLGMTYVEYLIIIDIGEACALVCLAFLALFLLRYFHPSIARTACEAVSRWYTSGKEVIFPKNRKTLTKLS
jgi:hypothetical protein